jgi:hypothetical protein
MMEHGDPDRLRPGAAVEPFEIAVMHEPGIDARRSVAQLVATLAIVCFDRDRFLLELCEELDQGVLHRIVDRLAAELGGAEEDDLEASPRIFDRGERARLGRLFQLRARISVEGAREAQVALPQTGGACVDILFFAAGLGEIARDDQEVPRLRLVLGGREG